MLVKSDPCYFFSYLQVLTRKIATQARPMLSKEIAPLNGLISPGLQSVQYKFQLMQSVSLTNLISQTRSYVKRSKKAGSFFHVFKIIEHTSLLLYYVQCKLSITKQTLKRKNYNDREREQEIYQHTNLKMFKCSEPTTKNQRNLNNLFTEAGF